MNLETSIILTLIVLGGLLIIAAYLKKGLKFLGPQVHAEVGELNKEMRRPLFIVGCLLILAAIILILIPRPIIIQSADKPQETDTANRVAQLSDTSNNKDLSKEHSPQTHKTKPDSENDQNNTQSGEEKTEPVITHTVAENTKPSTVTRYVEPEVKKLTKGFVQIGVEKEYRKEFFIFYDTETGKNITALEGFAIGKKIRLGGYSVLYGQVPSLKDPLAEFDLKSHAALHKNDLAKVVSNPITVRQINKVNVFYLEVEVTN